ncbi:hypothetical protein [Kutzneria albida]|uniref:hypothetical protein n=1 Tax=Kutzneria albida TaxID=43357 RepID=UPI0011DDB114|nr:hypothetical protein [Kutzneria albida]
MRDRATINSIPGDEWLGTTVLDHVRQLHNYSPDIADKVLEMAAEQLKFQREMDEKQSRHTWRLEWAWFGFRVLMATLGFTALVVYSTVSVRLIESGDALHASLVLGAGTASVVAIFVTGRSAGPLLVRKRADHTTSAPADRLDD